MTCLNTWHCCLVIRQKSHQKGCDTTPSLHILIVLLLYSCRKKPKNNEIAKSVEFLWGTFRAIHTLLWGTYCFFVAVSQKWTVNKHKTKTTTDNKLDFNRELRLCRDTATRCRSNWTCQDRNSPTYRWFYAGHNEKVQRSVALFP